MSLIMGNPFENFFIGSSADNVSVSINGRKAFLLSPCVAALIAVFASSPAQSQTALSNSNTTISLQAQGSGASFSVAPGVLIDSTVLGGPGISGNASQAWVLNNQGTINGATYGIDFSAAGNTQIVNSGTIGGVGVGPASAPVIVQTGSGNDQLSMTGGTINGGVNQGDGSDTFSIGAGAITGGVQQGSGVDDFAMTGGTIQSLEQGDGLDTFFMSGGTIVKGFDDGDVGRMTGGTIGRVDMKLDDNIFDMSGGTIEGNLVAGFGNDTIRLSNGFIGGNISVSGGTDNVTITGGELRGEVRMSAGVDTFTWSDGGKVGGLIDMGLGDDTALLRNLPSSLLAGTAGFTGGAGVDALTLNNAQTGGIARFANWENVQLQRNSQLQMDGDLVLGDAGASGVAATQTGALSLDSTSTLFAVGGVASSIRPVAAGSMADVSNAGTLDLRGGNAKNRLTIEGNYTGQNGQLKVDSVLGADDAPSDRLVVARGRIAGTTGLAVNNLGGMGGLTALDGIMVVQAANGASSDASAFALTGPVQAGAYDYYLYHGGVTEGTANNFYLRSSVPATAELASGQAAPVAAPVYAGPGQQQLAAAPLPAPAAQAVPIYRPEVPVYTAMTGTARQLAVFTLGTFHDRQGEQSLLDSQGRLPGSWARVYGENTDVRWQDGAQSEFDGSISGAQLGQDLYAVRHDNGHQDRVGAFLGYAHADGDVRGLTGGFSHMKSGGLDIDGYSAGLYWTHVGPQGGYVDVVGMYTRLDADLRSVRGMKENTDGSVWTASVEGGYPVALTDSVILEPQAQLIGQHVSIDDLSDKVSSVQFKDSDSYRGRIGVRLKTTLEYGQARIEPYLRANLWREFSGTDETVFAHTDSVVSRYGSTTMQWGGGVAAKINKTLSIYASADYIHDVAGGYQRGLQGRLGMRIAW